MPLTDKGKKILEDLKKEYGEKKGKEVFYKMEAMGKITGVKK